MKIKGIHVNGFGTLRDYDPGRLSPGLTVFEGQNEAGKSTLMAYIRAILLGFPGNKGKGAKYERYEPINGGLYGGSLTLLDEDGLEFRVQRTPGKGGGHVTVFLPDGSQEGEAYLQRLMGGISPILFKQIFAFSLTELQQLDFLESEEISSYIYSAGMGSGASVLEVDKKLDGAMNGIFKPRASNPSINVLTVRLKEIEKQISQLQKNASRYNDLVEEEKELEGKFLSAEQALDDNRKEEAWLETLDKGKESWEALAELGYRLQQIPPTHGFPADGLYRLEQVLTEKRKIEVSIRQAQEKIEKIKEEMDRLAWNPLYGREKGNMERLLRNAGRVKETQQLIGENRAKIRHQEERLQQTLQQMGHNWQEKDLISLDISVGQKEQVRLFRDRLLESGKERMKIESNREQINKEIHQQRVKYASLQREVPSSSIEDLEKEIQLKEAAIKEIKEIRMAIEGVQREEAFLQERQDEIKERLAEIDQQFKLEKRPGNKGKRPRWFFPVVLGFGLILSVVLGTQNLWLGIFTGFLTLLALLFGGNNRGQDRSPFLQEERRKWAGKLAEMESRLKGIRQELDQFHSQLQEQGKKLKMASLSLTALARLEEDIQEKRRKWMAYLQAREKVKDLESRIKDLEEELRGLEEHSGQGEREESVRKEWAKWLSDRQLDARLSPEGVLDYFRLAESGREILSQLTRDREEYQRDRDFLHTFSQEVQEICIRVGMADFSLEDPLSSFLLLHNRLKEEEEKSYKWNQWEKECRTLAEEIAALNIDFASLLQEENELYKKAGVEEQEAFRLQGENEGKRRALLEEVERRESELLLLAGSIEKKNKLEKDFSLYDSYALARELEGLREKIADIQEQLNRWRERKGELRVEINSIEQEGTLSRLLQEREETLTQLHREARQWGVYAICRHWLKEAREKYERERQPGVLRQATYYFSTITDGKYQRILAPLGSETLLVESATGEHIEVGFLSRGTREQLYLVMRFALAREFSRQVSLPLIMDDILVNFDLKRLHKTIDALREISQHHQILFFTCHPYISKILLDEIAGSKLIRLGNPIVDSRYMPMK